MELATFGPAVLLFIAVVWRPRLGAFLLLGVTPLIVGIERGTLGLPLRPNELLLSFVLAAVLTRTVLLMLAGAWRPAPLDRIDLALLCVAFTSSVLPLLWRACRGYDLSQEDWLYAIVLTKYYIVYRIFRTSIFTPEDVARCVTVAMCSAALVGIVALLQVTHSFGIPQFLHAYYEQPFEGHLGILVDRASSTVANAFGFGDMMIMSLILALALQLRRPRHRILLLAASALYLAGCLASGEFSEYIGAALAIVAFGVVTRTLHRLLPAAIVAAALFAIPLWPVLERRLAGFESDSGVPHSWKGRLENLERFFLPDLTSGLNWLFGVRPAARVAAPETWRTWVYIESGYIWLLWVGGIPLLLAFVWFAVVSLSELRRRAVRPDASGAVATAAFCFLLTLVVLMLADPHLTVRGGADLFFPLLALAFVPLRQPAPARLVALRLREA